MINIIVATDEDLLIGKKDSRNGMPWNVPEDLQHFKATTLNKTILMGLTTYQAQYGNRQITRITIKAILFI